MGKILLVYDGNYADEFNFTAGTVVDSAAWPSSLDDPMLEGIDLDEEHERYYGTNESVFVTIREVILQTDTITLETEKEEQIARRLGGTFDVVFDVVFGALYEKEEREKKKRNKERWLGLTDKDRAEYIELCHTRNSIPFKSRKEEYMANGEALAKLWEKFSMEGYYVNVVSHPEYFE